MVEVTDLPTDKIDAATLRSPRLWRLSAEVLSNYRLSKQEFLTGKFIIIQYFSIQFNNILINSTLNCRVGCSIIIKTVISFVR